MNALSETLFDIARSQNLKHLAIQEAARTNPAVQALYSIWLIATDSNEDSTRAEHNEEIQRIEKLAKQALGLT